MTTKKITVLGLIDADRWENEHVTQYSTLDSALASLAAQRAHDCGYEVVAESPGVFPNSQIIRYRSDTSARWTYVFATIEEIAPPPYTGKTLAGAYAHATMAADALEAFITSLPGERTIWQTPRNFGDLTLDAGRTKLDLLLWREWAKREIAERGDLDGKRELPEED